ncbi:MAG: shikimate dehydrogenase [Rhodanobacteraceae bacterium]
MTAIPHYAVFGHPVAHSLSPRLHTFFGAQAGIEMEYIALDAEPAEFAGAVRAFFAVGGSGVNVTLPHKAAAFELADVRSVAAERLGVANVLTSLPDGRIEAESNDGVAMLADLHSRRGVDPAGRNVLLLGAGGAARAAAFALRDADVRRLVIVNRTFERAAALAEALAQPDRVCISRWDALERCAPFDLIVNATSAGVQQVQLTLPVSLVDAKSIAYDLSYGLAAQPFLAWASRAGSASAFDGLGMLLETAAASFERWHGVRPDVDAARRTLRGESRL